MERATGVAPTLIERNLKYCDNLIGQIVAKLAQLFKTAFTYVEVVYFYFGIVGIAKATPVALFGDYYFVSVCLYIQVFSVFNIKTFSYFNGNYHSPHGLHTYLAFYAYVVISHFPRLLFCNKKMHNNIYEVMHPKNARLPKCYHTFLNIPNISIRISLGLKSALKARLT